MILKMKRIDFENGSVTQNIFAAALPMLVAQILNLLYNIVDRIYIARIPHIGTAALGAVGLCFPLVVIITAFANLFGSGGAPLFSISRGQKKNKQAVHIMNTSFTMVCFSAVVLMLIGLLFARPLLILFGASKDALVYAFPYMMIYLIGTLPSMIAIGMNPFINAPRTPNPNAKIKNGSSSKLATAPIATENIPMVEYPCALINGFIPMAIIDGSVPIR